MIDLIHQQGLKMRDPARIDRMLRLIREIWFVAPDLRLGQLLANASPEMERGLFFHEDHDLEVGLERLKAEHIRVPKP